jgi:hypothetical protein
MIAATKIRVWGLGRLAENSREVLRLIAVGRRFMLLKTGRDDNTGPGNAVRFSRGVSENTEPSAGKTKPGWPTNPG